MTEREPTIRSRELGLALSRAAQAKGMNGRELAVRRLVNGPVHLLHGRVLAEEFFPRPD